MEWLEHTAVRNELKRHSAALMIAALAKAQPDKLNFATGGMGADWSTRWIRSATG